MSRWEGKYVIGLTGNIAVGKSVVRQMLQHLGAYTLDADSLTHQAMAPGAPAHAPIIETFGKIMLAEDGTINRTLLGAVAFAVPEVLTRLESIVHPVVQQATNALVSRAKQPIIIIEAIKLMESSTLMESIDSVWVVDASPETQLQRLVEKRKMTDAEARKRIVAQTAQSGKVARANTIIMNDGNVEETWRQVQAGWNDVRRAMMGRGITLEAPSTPEIQSAPRAQPTAPAQPPPRAPQSSPAPTQSAVPSAPSASRPQPTVPIAPPPPAIQPLRPLVQPLMPSAKPVVPSYEVHIRRGMPGNAESIARFISRVTGKNSERMEVMLAFGQKSYLLAVDEADTLIGVTGWQVENLITRVDEFYLDMSVPRDPVIRALTHAMEEASRELQSEVSFMYLPPNTPVDVIQTLISEGYNFLKMEEVKFPAWREAARELTASDGNALIKQLRADRVMKPI